MHELAGFLHVVAGEFPVAFDDVAADDHRFDVGRSGPEDHDGDGVADSVQVGGAKVSMRRDRDAALPRRDPDATGLLRPGCSLDGDASPERRC